LKKEIVEFFKELGFPSGVKGDRIRIPPQIIEDRELSLACLRGIFNTDGSIYRRYSKRYGKHVRAYDRYAVIQFKMKNHQVIAQIREILEREGIKANRTIRTGNCSVLRITSQKGIQRFFREVGFSHKHHRRRFLEITGKEIQTMD
jgi:DNA-binding transcriptional regulator WhiA